MPTHKISFMSYPEPGSSCFLNRSFARRFEIGGDHASWAEVCSNGRLRFDKSNLCIFCSSWASPEDTRMRSVWLAEHIIMAKTLRVRSATSAKLRNIGLMCFIKKQAFLSCGVDAVFFYRVKSPKRFKNQIVALRILKAWKTVASQFQRYQNKPRQGYVPFRKNMLGSRRVKKVF